MTSLPNCFVFMKVGDHAGESWKSILERKNREYRDAGMIFWGYGGGPCHPIKQVQPFAGFSTRKQGEVILAMEPINSKVAPDVVPATEYSTQYSEDGVHWKPIPNGISVTGSRYAFVLDEIKPCELELRLDEYEVGWGKSKGKAAESYLKWPADKACLIRIKKSRLSHVPRESIIRRIGYTATLREPFAVLLR
ncbi:MAG: hypothetical protein V3W34_09535 [Phycisphaerae bacterium]